MKFSLENFASELCRTCTVVLHANELERFLDGSSCHRHEKINIKILY